MLKSIQARTRPRPWHPATYRSLYAVGATSVILSAANGADIKVLNMYSRSPKAFCMYSKDDSLTTPESLKGKTIAGPAGTNLHELLAAYLATGGHGH